MEKRQTLKFIKKESFVEFLKSLTPEYNVVVPQGESDYIFSPFSGEFVFNKYRAVTSFRQFLVPSQRVLLSYFKPSQLKRKPYCIVGVKNCDLTSLMVQDYVFGEDDLDPDYSFWRKESLIISGDCTSYKSVCFCLQLGIRPYPEKLFDLNLTPLHDGFLVEIGSSKGEEVTQRHSSLFSLAPDGSLEVREKFRKELINALEGELENKGLPSKEKWGIVLKEGKEDIIWEEEAKKCVECGACINNCPTCHCFLLFDEEMEEKKGEFIRARIWDGCQYKNFARVAGGANPLRFRSQRLRNRYIKKFEFFLERIGMYACTGCGRCIESCIAKIDLREIFNKLKNSKKL